MNGKADSVCSSLFQVQPNRDGWSQSTLDQQFKHPELVKETTSAGYFWWFCQCWTPTVGPENRSHKPDSVDMDTELLSLEMGSQHCRAPVWRWRRAGQHRLSNRRIDQTAERKLYRCQCRRESVGSDEDVVNGIVPDHWMATKQFPEA